MSREEAQKRCDELNSQGNSFHIEECADGWTIVAEASGAAKGSALNALRHLHDVLNEDG